MDTTSFRTAAWRSFGFIGTASALPMSRPPRRHGTAPPTLLGVGPVYGTLLKNSLGLFNSMCSLCWRAAKSNFSTLQLGRLAVCRLVPALEAYIH